ncbi:hypothetical protein COU55_03245 [Candidatus Pacearchaeota archaeon CG10_big_fil_rev_8_21_14_0_10_31_59]|nr:MAG: hypothetical protein COU55_03245 [Candidatus Pacearchaeota archaeon CG10_big_fil_rev_8_21_14_0_10_31_59]
MANKTLRKIVTMGVPFLVSLPLVLGGCEKKATDSQKNIFVTTGRIYFRNCDGGIYEAFVDGQSKGAIPENPDPSKCYPYSYGAHMFEVVDTFVNPGIGVLRSHMLDFRSGNIIHDTYEFFAVPDHTDPTTYYYGEFCIKSSKFVDCD